MKTYKGRTAQERRKSHYQMKKALKQGIIPPPTQCKRCGQTEGIIEYHNADYSHPYLYLMPLCYTCHTLEHCRDTHPEQVDYYCYLVTVHGKQFPPMYTRSYFKIKSLYLTNPSFSP